MNSENKCCGGNSCPSPCSCACSCACCPEPCTTVCKLEPPCKAEFPCTPQICKIFGGHDLYNPDQDPYQSPRSKPISNLHTLGMPIGLVKSTIVVKSLDVGTGSELQAQKFATYLKAFAQIYLTPETEWTPTAIDQLLKEGIQLYTDSKESQRQLEEAENNPDENADADAAPKPPKNAPITEGIYDETEDKINKAFKLAETDFQIELTVKLDIKPELKSSSPAALSDDEPTDMNIKHLRQALKEFFRKKKYCLLKTESWYLLIWKVKGTFFIFDFYGRRPVDFYKDDETGVAMLICLKHIDNVGHLIGNLSGLTKTSTFSLREMKVVKLGAPDGQTYNRDYGKRTFQYEVVNSDYAFLLAGLHLTLNRADALRNRSALPVGVAAMLVSKMDHPATWNQKVLDKIICYGVNVCRCCWEQCLHNNEPIDIHHFPNQLKMGQFITNFELMPLRAEGIWKCVPEYKKTELSNAFEMAFENFENNLLLQIDHQVYAIWKKNNFIYFFDPYRHRVAGNTDVGSGGRSAALRMFRSLDVFLSVLNLVLLETNRTTRFVIHSLRIRKIELAENADGAADGLERNLDEDARSLNENICFEEDEAKCLEELGKISDYEEEDSDVEQIDMKEPKSESDIDEEAMEEEEGALEDLGEYESSSSGGGRRKRGKGKGKGRGSKGGKGKGKIKRDKNKNEGKNKGKGDKDKKKDKGNKDEKGKGKGGKGDDKRKPSKDKPGKGDRPSDKDDKDKDGKDKNDGDKQGRDDDGKGKDDGFGGTDDGRGGKGDRDDGKSEDFGEEEGACKGGIQPNTYPGYSKVPHDMAVVGSEDGTYESICKLLRAGFKCADRILTMTPWGNYVIFRGYDMFKKVYFLFDGCTCNVNRFRHLDLNCGTAGLLCFPNLHDVICYIIDSQRIRRSLKKSRKNIIDEICREFCN